MKWKTVDPKELKLVGVGGIGWQEGGKVVGLYLGQTPGRKQPHFFLVEDDGKKLRIASIGNLSGPNRRIAERFWKKLTIRARSKK